MSTPQVPSARPGMKELDELLIAHVQESIEIHTTEGKLPERTLLGLIFLILIVSLRKTACP